MPESQAFWRTLLEGTALDSKFDHDTNYRYCYQDFCYNAKNCYINNRCLLFRDFLPRGDGMVTRRPLILKVTKDAVGDERAIFQHKKDEIFHNFQNVKDEIKAESDRDPGQGVVNDKPISLQIYLKESKKSN